MEELKKHNITLAKKVKELETSEALTNWKIISSDTTIEGLKTKEQNLTEQLNEVKKALNAKELKIMSNIHMQDEVTEEMNSYKARYDKQNKELLESKKEAQRYRNNYQMVSQSLSRLNSKYDNLEQKYVEWRNPYILNDISQQNIELRSKLESFESTICDLK